MMILLRKNSVPEEMFESKVLIIQLIGICFLAATAAGVRVKKGEGRFKLKVEV